MTHFEPSLKNLQQLETLYVRFDITEYIKDSVNYFQALLALPKLRRICIALEYEEWERYASAIETWFTEFNKKRDRRCAVSMFPVQLKKTKTAKGIKSRSIVMEEGMCSSYCLEEKHSFS